MTFFVSGESISNNITPAAVENNTVSAVASTTSNPIQTILNKQSALLPNPQAAPPKYYDFFVIGFPQNPLKFVENYFMK